MAIRARTRPLYAKYAFRVRDPSGIMLAKFQKATGAGMSLNIAEYSEGGAIAPMKEATRATFSNINLEHGVSDNTDFVDWAEECCDMLAHLPEGTGVLSPEQLRNLCLDQLKRNRSVLFTLHLYNCQPADFKPGEFDNTSGEIQVESMEISTEYFKKEYK